MAIVKIKSIEDINLPKEPKIKGANGEIYQYTSSLYFKKLSDERSDLTSSFNVERLKILAKIMKLKDTKCLILPQDIYITSDTFLGYTTLISTAPTIRNLSLDTKYNDLIKAFRQVSADIKVLAKNHIFHYDTTQDNILFDGEIHLLDFDDCFLDNYKSYERMMYNIFLSLYAGVVKDGYGSKVLMENDLEKLLEKFAKYQSVDYELYFKLLQKKLEYDTCKKIKTVGDLRKSLSRTKKG